MQDDRQLPCHGDLGFLEADAFRQSEAPGFQRTPMGHAGEQHTGRLEEIAPHHPITAFGDAAGPIDLTRGMAARGQPEVGADTPRAPEAGWLVDCGTEGQGIDRPNPRHRHQTTALFVVAGQGQESAGETGDFSAHDLAHAK